MTENRDRSVEMARRDRSAFLIIDFQERLVPHIHGTSEILTNLVRIAQAAPVLNVPLLVTEQYPKGLGPTIPELDSHLRNVSKIEKIAFSCFGEPDFVAHVKDRGIETLFVSGIETHVCVAQTVLHALAEGLSVHVLADAVGSRNPHHAEIALGRLRDSGAVVSCTEMVLFELLECAGTPEFKQIQNLIKD